MRILAASNDNLGLTGEEISSRLDWVRPIAIAMRAAALPESVVQMTMGDLLRNLDAYLDGEPTLLKAKS